jgi:hypothetical protein
MKPRALLTSGEVDVRLCPSSRPVIFGTIEACRGHPVAQGEIERVVYAEPALLRRVDEKESAQRPERLSAEALLAFLVDQQDRAACVGGFGGGDESGESGTDDQHVRAAVYPHLSAPGEGLPHQLAQPKAAIR